MVAQVLIHNNSKTSNTAVVHFTMTHLTTWLIFNLLVLSLHQHQIWPKSHRPIPLLFYLLKTLKIYQKSQYICKKWCFNFPIKAAVHFFCNPILGGWGGSGISTFGIITIFINTSEIKFGRY